LEAIENVMEKRGSLGLFSFAIFLPLIPPLPLKSKRSLKTASPASENHLAIVPLGWIQPQSPLGSACTFWACATVSLEKEYRNNCLLDRRTSKRK
jgi:hypothetical protein